jgi:prolyl 4-hydroxylase
MSSIVDKLTYEHLKAYRPAADLAEIVVVPDFLPIDICHSLVRLIESRLRPSTISDDNGDPLFRTSQTADLPASNSDVQVTEALLNLAHGINPHLGEPLQGQRYEIGQEFKPHTDYFDPGSPNFPNYTQGIGNRTWTFMLYLNDVTAGGSTHFPKLDLTLRPEVGKLIAWNNLNPDGTPNINTLHHGMRVRQGMKYVLTKWYRERAWK